MNRIKFAPADQLADLGSYCSSKIDYTVLKGISTLMINMFCKKELYEPLILIQVLSKLDEKWGSYGHLKNSI